MSDRIDATETGRRQPAGSGRRTARWLALIALIVAAGVWSAPAVGQHGTGPHALVIDGATLIDGTGAPPVGNTTIVVEGAKITQVGPAAAVRRPAGAHVIDAKGKFVLPGLIDGHTHWRGWSGELFLAHGVTTIIDLGNTSDWILAVKGAEEAGELRGPRLFTSAGGIDRRVEEGGAGWAVNSSPYRISVEGAAEARDLARKLIYKGADILKIFTDMHADELKAITDEAHKVDVPVVGHTSDVYAAVNAGMDGVTHLWGVAVTLMSPENQARYRENRLACPYAWMEADRMDALVAFLVERGTYINTCLINEHTGVLPKAREYELADYELLMNPRLRYVPLQSVLASLTFWRKLRSYSPALGSFPYVDLVEPSVLEEFRRGYRNAQEFTRRFAKAGGRIFAGTDAAGSASLPGASLHKELELLVDAGLTPMEAILTATRHPAELVRRDYKLGSVTVGKLADLLILDADPLADIRNTQKIHTVIKNGEVVDRTYHPEYYPAFTELEAVGISSSSAPVPVITGIVTETLNTWSMVIAQGSPFELIVRGRGFHITSLVHLNGRPLETRFVSRSELRARVPSDRIPTPGTYAVTVVNPWPGGGTSNTSTMTVK